MKIMINHSKKFVVMTAIRETDDGLYQIYMWPKSRNGLSETEGYVWQIHVRNPMKPTSSLSSSMDSSGNMGTGVVKAPMSGKISRMLVSSGDVIDKGDVIVVMEAMKMEHNIIAPISGRLESFHYRVDDIVQDGSILGHIVAIEDDEEKEATA